FRFASPATGEGARRKRAGSTSDSFTSSRSDSKNARISFESSSDGATEITTTISISTPRRGVTSTFRAARDASGSEKLDDGGERRLILDEEGMASLEDPHLCARDATDNRLAVRHRRDPV